MKAYMSDAGRQGDRYEAVLENRTQFERLAIREAERIVAEAEAQGIYSFGPALIADSEARAILAADLVAIMPELDRLAWREEYEAGPWESRTAEESAMRFRNRATLAAMELGK